MAHFATSKQNNVAKCAIYKLFILHLQRPSSTCQPAMQAPGAIMLRILLSGFKSRFILIINQQSSMRNLFIWLACASSVLAADAGRPARLPGDGRLFSGPSTAQVLNIHDTESRPVARSRAAQVSQAVLSEDFSKMTLGGAAASWGMYPPPSPALPDGMARQ